jgi:hypothetical protein
MAKKDKELFDVLRDSGVRKKVANALSDSASKADQAQTKAAKQAASSLRHAAAVLENHTKDARHSEAAQKAARTRKRNAARRSSSAKKAARTRAGAR